MEVNPSDFHLELKQLPNPVQRKKRFLTELVKKQMKALNEKTREGLGRDDVVNRNERPSRSLSRYQQSNNNFSPTPIQERSSKSNSSSSSDLEASDESTGDDDSPDLDDLLTTSTSAASDISQPVQRKALVVLLFIYVSYGIISYCFPELIFPELEDPRYDNFIGQWISSDQLGQRREVGPIV